MGLGLGPGRWYRGGVAAWGEAMAGSFRIGAREVGPEAPVYIVAEAGSNHDRDLERALALVDAAAEAGADAVKFQAFFGPDIGSGWKGDPMPAKYARWGDNLRDFYAALALPREFYPALDARCRERGVDFLCSVFSEEALAFVEALDPPAYKIASFELTHSPLLRATARLGKPILLSTGMASLGEIEAALQAIAEAGPAPVAVLHCGSSYPLSVEAANVRAVETIARAFPCPVGYSDHTVGAAVSTVAVALGASVIEKHFTLSRALDGPDHDAFALEPGELKDFVAALRVARGCLGDGIKRRQPEEEEMARRGRRSLFAARDLPEGHVLAEADLRLLRPGVGLGPDWLPRVVGLRLRRALEADAPLTRAHLDG